MKDLWAILITVYCFSFIIAQETIAVVDFDGKGVSDTEASALTDRFASELFNLGIYTLIERQRVGEILEEQGFQQSGCTTAECAVEVGQLLGSQLIISGSISKVGNVFSVSSRIISVETGEIYKMSNHDHQGEIGKLLMTGINIAVNKLISGEVPNLKTAPRIIVREKYGSLAINSGSKSVMLKIRNLDDTKELIKPRLTPLKFENIVEGEYEISFEDTVYVNYLGDGEITNYISHKDTVEIIDNEITTLNITLIKSEPRVGFKTKPGDANIIIDGEMVGFTNISPMIVKSGTREIKFIKDGYIDYVDTLTLEDGTITELTADLIKKPGSLFIKTSFIANYELSGLSNTGLYNGETNTILKEVPSGKYKLTVQRDGYLSSIFNINKSEWDDDYVYVSLVSRDSLEQELTSLKRKPKLWIRSSIFILGMGSIFWYSADNNYKKYQTAVSDADKIYSTIETQDKLYTILFSGGGVGLMRGLYIQSKIKKLNKVLDDGFIEEQ